MWRVMIALLMLPAIAAEAQPEGPAPVPLSITLGANEETELTLWPGTPLTFTAELENLPAAEALAAASSIEQTKASLEAAVADGRMSREEADRELGHLGAAPTIPPPISVAAVAARFTWFLVDGAPAPWTPKLVTPEGPAVVLDGKALLAVAFVVAPEGTQATPPGEYHLRLRYSGAGTPPGEWAGTVVSEEVVVTVAAAPANPTAEQQWQRAYAFSLYHLATGDFAAVAGDVDTMLKAQPESVLARAQLGRAKEGLKDLTGALAAYQEALHLHVTADPRGEPPFWLMEMEQRVAEQLAPTGTAQAPPAGPAATATIPAVRFQLPAGWQRTDRAGEIVLVPANVPPGQAASLVIGKATEMKTDLGAYFVQAWANQTRDTEVSDDTGVQTAAGEAGEEGVFRGGWLQAPDGQRSFVLLLVARTGSHVFHFTYKTASPQAIARDQQTLDRFFSNISFAK